MTHSSNRERAAAQKSHADFLAAYGLTELDVPMVVLDLTDAPDATDAYATQRSNPRTRRAQPMPHTGLQPRAPCIQPATLCIQPATLLSSLQPYVSSEPRAPTPG